MDQHESNIIKKALASVPSHYHREVWRIAKNYSIEEAITVASNLVNELPLNEPLAFSIWGSNLIDQIAIDQMNIAMRLPHVLAGALMPDSHLGYGLPIGGVLQTDHVVIPGAVGYDIHCMMMFQVFDNIIVEDYESGNIRYFRSWLEHELVNNTRFGMDEIFKGSDKVTHPVLNRIEHNFDPFIRQLLEKADEQLGSSGSGNHFVSIGEYNGKLTILSHSGSRGFGYKIADHYIRIAEKERSYLEPEFRKMAWLDVNKGAGEEYMFNAMQVAGEYAIANHEIIHMKLHEAFTGNRVSHITDLNIISNTHNYAWPNMQGIIHRKGATPAHAGDMGIIPGNVAFGAYVVQGKGNSDSLNSASHGAGRAMGRNQAKANITIQQLKDSTRSVIRIGGGLDEAPQAYKNLDDVMAAQTDLVKIVGRFTPIVCRMADDGSTED